MKCLANLALTAALLLAATTSFAESASANIGTASVSAITPDCEFYYTFVTNLPSGVHRVEYLQSSGTQYIITDQTTSTDAVFSMGFMTVSAVSTSYQWFFGGGRSAGKTGLMALAVSGGKWYHEIKGSNVTAGSVVVNTYYDIIFQTTQFSVNGTVYSTGATSVSTSSDRINIFRAVNGSSQYDNNPNCRFYYFQISKGGTLVRDFIPVRFKNENGVQEGAMYDRVTKQLFRNAGTGSFIIGDDIEPKPEDITTNWHVRTLPRPVPPSLSVRKSAAVKINLKGN